MACRCHTKTMEHAEKTHPTEQCLYCAQKHYATALGAAREYTYEQSNRDWVLAQLQAVIGHTSRDYAAIASLARDAAHEVQEGRDTDIRWGSLGDAIQSEINRQNPDTEERIRALNERVDIIIPLGKESRSDNDELRILLRSIDENAHNLGKVYIATHCCPAWLNRDAVTIVDIDDVYTANKDANLHLKVIETIKRHKVGKFVFCADDNAIVNPVRLNAIPVAHSRSWESYDAQGNVWHTRVRNTIAWMKSRGGEYPDKCHECHAPQLFDGAKLVEGMKGVDYAAQPGLVIYSTWRFVTDSWRNSVPQAEIKETAQGAADVARMTFAKPFVGYNDSGFFEGGLRQKLLAMFSRKSRFEK